MMLIIYSAGLRIGEAVRLKLEDIDFERKLIHIKEGKGKKRTLYDPIAGSNRFFDRICSFNETR